jgi:hypothetical protein
MDILSFHWLKESPQSRNQKSGDRDIDSFPVVCLIGCFYSIMSGLMLGCRVRPVTDVVFPRI